MAIPGISTNQLITSREPLYQSDALLIKHGVCYSLSVVNAARRSRFLAIPFWHSNLGHKQCWIFPTLRGIPSGLPLALVCQYFDTALLISLPHLHVADGISG
jgi:hypothetical protein